MGIKAFNHGDDFVNKFVRAVVSDSTGGDAVGPNAPVAPSGIEATGGLITDYTSGPAVYRAHVFTASGAFTVTALSNDPSSFPNTADVLVVGSGGGGGTSGGGGGGGGVRYHTGQPVTVTPYPVTINAGGAGRVGGGSGTAAAGGSVTFGSGSHPINITSPGGGGGGSHNEAGGPGASGGGAGRDTSSSGGSDTGSPHPGATDVPSGPNPAPAKWFGNPGGQGPSSSGGDHSGGGGGGARDAGVRGYTNSDGAGGPGASYTIANGNEAKYGAGGGGGRMDTPAGIGGATGYSPFTTPTNSGKGGHNPTPVNAVPGQAGFGQGGGGGHGAGGPTSGPGGNGGSGTVVIRYKIADVNQNLKATGGDVSFYDNKTIHVFKSSGTFTTGPSWTSGTSVEYVVIAGGGGGGKDDGGGGGAGAVRAGTTPVTGPVTIQVGGGGAQHVNGTDSYFGTPITAAGGGKGGTETPSSVAGADGGSGGGGAGGFGSGAGGTGSGDPFPGSSPFDSPSNGWGNDGGSGGSSSPAPYSGGGGGGASGAGANNSQGNYGGRGMLLSPTFRDPSLNTTIGSPEAEGYGAPITAGQYFAGGGGGTRISAPGTGNDDGVGGIGGGGWGGGNKDRPAQNKPFRSGTDAVANTGSGGGGGDFNNESSATGGSGGSGIVLIAYPS